MPSETFNVILAFDIDESYCEAKASYDYEPGDPGDRDEEGWNAEATNVVIEFRHNAPKDAPEFPWAANPFLEQLVDTPALRKWLVEQYEGAALNYAYGRAAE